MRQASTLLVALAMSASLLPQYSFGQKKEHPERKVIEKVDPEYPELAKRMHMTGVVKVEAVVRANGSVKSTKALGGNPVLIDAATEAVRKWKFEATAEETTEGLQITFDYR